MEGVVPMKLVKNLFCNKSIMISKTRKIRVMHVILNCDIGGGQEVVRTLVEHLASDECTPIVCTFKDGPLRRDIEQSGIKVEVVPPRRYSIVAFPLFVADMIRIWRALARLVRKYDIDVVQTHLLRTLDFVVLLLKYTTSARVVLWTFHSVKFVLTEAEMPRYRWLLGPKRYAHHQLCRLASHFVDGFIAVSDQVKEAMVEIIGPIQDKITVICNGVDVKRYGRPGDKTPVRNELGLEENARLITVVGTLKDQKGHRYMIEAMTSIVPRYPSAHALFIGDGDLGEELQAQATALNVDAHIHFLGSRRDVPELLASSDLFVLPSLWEGLSMALLEAMATGLPIVASEVSGTVQVMIPGETGYLVPPGDVQGLFEAVEQLLSDPARAQAMGAAARRRVEATFSAQKQADEHVALYRRLLENASI
jgi:glycosyltransferase involved in cell wall biosynthesis